MYNTDVIIRLVNNLLEVSDKVQEYIANTCRRLIDIITSKVIREQRVYKNKYAEQLDKIYIPVYKYIIYDATKDQLLELT